MEIDRRSAWIAALGWLERERESFALPAATGDAEAVPRLKALGELARAADLVCRRRDLPEDLLARARSLLDWSWAQFGGGERIAQLLRERPHAVVLGTMYAIFAGHGLRHPDVELRLAAAATTRHDAAAAASFRPLEGRQVLAEYGRDGLFVMALGLAQAWRLLGLPSPWSEAALFPRTWLARRIETDSITAPDAYSLTHTVYFMTDWGDRPSGLDAAVIEYLRRHVPLWMKEFHRQGHIDLYSELALALGCVHALAEGAGVERTLRTVLDGDGSVVGPEGATRPLLAGVTDPGRRRFLERYHATLTALLGSLAATAGAGRSA